MQELLYRQARAYCGFAQTDGNASARCSPTWGRRYPTGNLRGYFGSPQTDGRETPPPVVAAEHPLVVVAIPPHVGLPYWWMHYPSVRLRNNANRRRLKVWPCRHQFPPHLGGEITPPSVKGILRTAEDSMPEIPPQVFAQNRRNNCSTENYRSCVVSTG